MSTISNKPQETIVVNKDNPFNLLGLESYAEQNANSTDPYVKMGIQWMQGKINIEEFNGFKLTPKQIEFVNDRSPESLVSGGYRCGKTVGLCVKLWLLCMWFPGNGILLGRKTRADLEATTLPTLFTIFPEGTYRYKVGPGVIEFTNGSKIFVKGLDTDGGGDDTKKASQKIRGMTLGAAAIDQLEEVGQDIYLNISGRLSIKIPYRPIFSTTNPATYWAYDYFKDNPRVGTSLVETGMLDNEANLPAGFIDQQMTKPRSYVERFVLGIWDPTNVQEGRVFPDDHLNESWIKEPLRQIAGINIFEEPKSSGVYQIGIDPSTGAEDPCHMVMIDKMTGKEVANFNGFVPVQAQIEAAHRMCVMYSLSTDVLAIPEVNGVGQAFIEGFKKVWNNIYVREIYSKREKKTTDKLGWYSSFANKTQIIESFKELLQFSFPKIADRKTMNEFKMFIYTDSAKKNGASCPAPYHDDRVMATLFAFIDVHPKTSTYEEEEDLVLYGNGWLS